MNEGLALLCMPISSLAFLANVVFLNIYFRCPLKYTKRYKFFYLLTAVKDIVLSIDLLLIVPLVVIERNTLVMIATGPIGSYPGGQLLMGVFLGCFLTKIMILLNGFIYRYLRICRSPASQGYLQQREFFIFLVVNGLVILNWAAILYICFWPSPLLIRESRPIVMTAIGRDSHPAMLGVTMNQRFNLVVGALAETVALLSFLLVVVLYSWYRIRVTLKSVTVSQNSRNIQRQVSTLLFIQSANPIIFFYMPIGLSLVCLFSGWRMTPFVSNFITIVISLCPLVNPFIIVLFLNDYRNYVLQLIRVRRRFTRHLPEKFTTPKPVWTIFQQHVKKTSY